MNRAFPNRPTSFTLVAVLLLAGLEAVVVSAPPAHGATGIALDKLVSAHQTTKSTSVTSPVVSTAAPGELLMAFLSTDGPNSPTETFTSVTGGGLTWRLRKRANAQFGTAEIWQAVAPAVLINATVRGTHTGSYQGAITVATFTGANLTVDGAVGGASAGLGAPSAALTTTRAGSWVWGGGNDWQAALARTVGPTQTKVDEYLASSGDTFWVQRQNGPTAGAGTAVTLNDTAPTADRWNLALIEIPAAAADTTAPSAPTGLTATAASATRVNLGWTAATDDTAVTGYRVLRDGVQVGTASATTYADTTVSASTPYAYTVRAVDAAGNVSPDSTSAPVTTPAATGPDTTPPVVSLTAPAAGATVSGTTAVSATATDDVGVAGVRFVLDGTDLAPEDTANPFTVPWNTTTAAAGAHTLTAVARDAAGNSTTSASVAVTVANSGADPAVVGSWGPVVTWPEVSIHAALTTTGKVLTFQGDFSQGGQQYLLNPVTGAYVQVPNATADLFCAGQAVLADGRILVIGGTSTSGGLGTRAVTAFNPVTEVWRNLAPMHYPRWYATGTTLADGRVLVTSGANTSATDLVDIPEIYDPATNTWSDLTSATRHIPFYPFMYQLPDGRVLQSGASEEATSTSALNVATGQWTTIDGRLIDGASMTNYAPGKFLKAGSASDSGFSGQSTNTAYTLDLNTPGATWQPTAPMAFARSFVNLTSLPDGTVLATGGGSDRSGLDETKAVKPAEIWNPATGTWRTVASLTTPRLYHSTALLLPDGRVWVSGSGGDPGVPDERNYQIYSPPYLFKGARPTITSAPGTVQYNASAFVATPDAADIASVSLIRTGSVTHSFDQNTRALPLSFTRTADGLTVAMPQNANLAPPGYYLLSIVNSTGVPSIGEMVRFPAPASDTVAPTAPAALTASATTGQIDLGWTAASDDVGVAAYVVYRSTTAGFVPGPANEVARVPSPATTYRDSGLAAGTYFYRVKAEDASANAGPASNEATATVAAAARGVTLDRLVTGHQNTAATTVSATGVTTTGTNELLLAFLSSDGPSTGGSESFRSVAGGGLTWTLRQRANAQAGTAEIWQAVAPAPLTNVTVTANQNSGSWQASINVAAFLGADTAPGAVVGTTASTGAPTATLTTTRAGSWVWGVGTDWSSPIARTMGNGQVMVDQFLAPAGDTYWVQRQLVLTPASGTAVTINDTGPTTDRYDLAIIEVLPAP